MSFLIPRLRLHPTLTRSIPRALPLLPLSRPLSLLTRSSFQPLVTPKQARFAHFTTRGNDRRGQKEEPTSSKCLFLGRLSFDANENDVEKVFERFGNVSRVRIPRDDGRSRGFGFIEFEHEADAVAAREAHEYSNIEFDGYPIRIKFAEPFATETSRPQGARSQTRERSPRERVQRDEPAPSNLLFLGSLPYETTEDAIERMFEQFGSLSAVRIGRHASGQSRGFAFIEFEDESSAVAAREQHKLSPIAIDGADLNIRFAEPRTKPERRQFAEPAEPSPSRCLFLGKLPFETMEDDLERTFGEFGTVSQVRIGRNTNGSSRCFGFIEFEDEASAIAARERHDATPFTFAEVPIRVKFAEPFGASRY